MNPGLPDQWRTLYSLEQWPGVFVSALFALVLFFFCFLMLVITGFFFLTDLVLFLFLLLMSTVINITVITPIFFDHLLASTLS